jgi:prepilin-type N-terminal cleavage/methylation domain-containing protein
VTAAGVRRLADDDEGMTLIELLVSITLLGIIVGPIVGMILLGFLSSDGTRDRIADSVSAQLVSSYMINDIQSATTVATSGGSCPGATGTVKLHLQMQDPTTGPTTVLYLDQINADGQHELHRVSCGATNSSTLVMHYLDPTSFNVTCSPSPACGAGVHNVKVNMTAKRSGGQPTSYYQPYAFNIQATRRAT